MKQVYLIGCDPNDPSWKPYVISYEAKFECKIIFARDITQVPTRKSLNDPEVLGIAPEMLINLEPAWSRPIETRQMRRKREREERKKIRS